MKNSRHAQDISLAPQVINLCNNLTKMSFKVHFRLQNDMAEQQLPISMTIL